MIHLGDITKISGYEVPIVDVVIGGSPCQDLSIAGKRVGLAGERSGLFMEQIRIVKEMRNADAKRGRTDRFLRPRFMVWENVPGTFSSNKGDDFRAVLEETIRIAEPEAPDVPLPAKGKWPLADCWYGDGWSIAYRVLDAQFWGVPQHRRRIALVADFGGHAAPEILFIRSGVCGDSEESGAPRETAAGRAGGDACVASEPYSLTNRGIFCGGVTETLRAEPHGALPIGLNDQGRRIMGTSVDLVGTLRAQEHGHQPIVCAGFKHRAGAKAESIGYEAETAPTLNAEQTAAVYDARGGTDYMTGWDCQEKRVFTTKGVAPTLSGSDGGRGRTVCGYIYDARGNGDGKTACTLTGDHKSRVTDYTAIVMATGQAGAEVTRDMVPTLNCNHEQPIIGTFQNTGQGWWNKSDIGATLRMPCGGDSTKANLVVAVDCRNMTENPEVTHTLQASAGGGTSPNSTPHIRAGASVRRLTPLECERLQGYPDGWTNIGEWVGTDGKLRKESSDSARYKALGNSIALPPWKWVLKRLCAQYERDATMASLFDGIGGFPLIWERLNGPGSCMWASEIEEFPMAVTKKRFEGVIYR